MSPAVRIRIEPKGRDTLKPLVERYTDFHARQIRADAAVDADPEGDMPTRGPD